MAMRSLLEARSRTVQDMRRITDNPEGDDGDLSEAQEKRFGDLKAELEKLERRIERQQAVDDAERRIAAPAIIHGNGRDGQFEERARGFSLLRAINDRLEPGSVDAGFEREISAEVRSRAGRPFQGIAVPDQYFHLERRTLTTGGDAASLYPEVHRADLFVDALRSALVVGSLGATIVDGLMGDIDIPKQTGSSAAQWVAEDAALTETDADFTDVTLSPKTVGAMTSYSRRTLINSSPSIEQILRNDLAAVIARAIDFQALLGDGTGNTPVGVINATGVANPTLATPSWAEVLAFVASIQSADANVGALGWTMNPNAVATLRSTTKVSSDAGAGFLMDTPDAMAGYRVAPTTAIPDVGGPPATDRTVIFGAWSQLLVGYWTGLDVLLNPYESAAYARGRVLIRAMRDVDVAVRHGESFAFASDLPI